MVTATYDILREAILHKRQVVAMYKGVRRELCPHILGTKGDRVYCLFYQFGGESVSRGPMHPGPSGNWRCIPIEGMSDITTREGAWHTAENLDKSQWCVDEIHLEASI